MNRKKRVKLIIRTLLTPFVQEPFANIGIWEEKLRAYDQMQHAGIDFIDKKRKYQAVRKRFIHMLEDRVSHDRISEIEQLMDFFYLDSEINDYIMKHDGGLDSFFFDKLQQIAQEFITLRDGRVSLRMWDQQESGSYGQSLFRGLSGLFRVELWSELSRTITPDLLIAAYFCACGIDDRQQLAGLPDTIFLSDSLLYRIQQEGVAETHVHFRACMSYLSVWEAVTDLTALRMFPTKKQPVFQQQQLKELHSSQPLLIAGYLRLMLAKYLESDCDVDLAEYFQPDSCLVRHSGMQGDDIELQEIAATQEVETLEWHILRHVLRQDTYSIEHLAKAIDQQRVGLVNRLYSTYDIRNVPALDLLQRGPYLKYAGLHTAPELLLLHSALIHVRDHPEHTQFSHTFLTYIRIKNCYFSDKLQSAGLSGLTFFRRYFDKARRSLAVRKDNDKESRRILYREAFRRQLHCLAMRKLEVKITPRAC